MRPSHLVTLSLVAAIGVGMVLPADSSASTGTGSEKSISLKYVCS